MKKFLILLMLLMLAPGCERNKASRSKKQNIPEKHMVFPLSSEALAFTTPLVFKPPLHLFFSFPEGVFDEGDELLVVDLEHLITEIRLDTYAFGLWVRKKDGGFSRWSNKKVLIGWREKPFQEPFPLTEQISNSSYWVGKRYSELLFKAHPDQDPWIPLEGIGALDQRFSERDAGFISTYLLTDYCVRKVDRLVESAPHVSPPQKGEKK